MQVGSVEENITKMADYLDSNCAQLAAEMTQVAAEMAHNEASRLISVMLTDALGYASKSPGVCVDTGDEVLVSMTPLFFSPSVIPPH